MNEIYEFEGTRYDVAPNRLEEFLQKFPGATKVQEQEFNPGADFIETIKQPSVQAPLKIEEPTTQSDDGSLELQKENKLKYNISNDKNGILDFLVSDKPEITQKLMANFFDKTEENAIKEMEAIFGKDENSPYEYEQTNDFKNFNKVIIKHKASGKEIELDFGIGKLMAADATLQSMYKSSNNKLFNFVNETLGKEDILKTQEAQTELVREVESLEQEDGPLHISTIEAGKINDKYQAEDLFAPKTVTTTKQSYGGLGAAPISSTRTEQPYKEELERSKQILINQGNENPTQEEIESLTRQNLYNKEYQELYDQKMNNYMNSGEVEETDLASRIKMGSQIKNSRDRKELFVYELNFNSKLNRIKNLPEVKRTKDVLNILNDPNQNFEITEGEEVVTLQDGRKMPKSLYSQYQIDVGIIAAENDLLYKWYDENSNKVIELIEKAKANNYRNDLIQRNYNDWDKFFYTMGSGFMGIVNKAAYGSSKLQSSLIGYDNKILDNEFLKMQDAQNAYYQTFQKDVKFENAFNRKNFGRFIAQEFAQQAPIFATLAVPHVGIATLGLSSAGENWERTVRDDEFWGKDTSLFKKFMTSVGYGTAEVVFDRWLTLPVMKRSYNAMYGSSKNAMLSGLDGVKLHFMQNGKRALLYDPLLETASEGLTTISQNIITDRPIGENLGHALFSGGMFGTMFGHVPFYKGVVMNYVSDYGSKKKYRDNLVTIADLKTKLDGTKQYVSLSTAKILNEELDALEKENQTILEDIDKKANSISKEWWNAYNDAVVTQEETRTKVEGIMNDKSLTNKEKVRVINRLQDVFSKAQGVRDALRDEKTFGSKFNAFLNSNIKEDVDRREEILGQVTSQLIADGNTNPSDNQINEAARIAYNIEEINKDFKNKRGKTKLGKSIENYQTVEQAIAAINKMDNVSDENKAAAIKNIEEGGHGANMPTTDGNFMPFQVVENMAKDDRLETRTHELGHTILSEAVSMNSKAFDGIADQILHHVRLRNPNLYILLKARSQGKSDEVLTNFLELVAGDKMDLKSKNNKGLGALMGYLFGKGVQKATDSDVEFNFEGETDAIVFITQLAKKIKAGTLTMKERKAIAKSKVFEPARRKDKILDGTDVRKPGVAFSKSASDKVQSIYDEQGEAGAFDIIEQFKPIVNKIVDKRSQAPNFDRQLLTDEIETGKGGIFDLIRTYDLSKGVPLAAYINDNLPKRAIEASRRVLGEEFTEDVTEKVDIAAEEVTTETKAKPQPKKIVLANRLNVSQKVNEAIKKVLPKLDVKSLTFKKLKNELPQITGEMFGISPKKLKTLANITKKELQAAQMFINKNADLLINMLPEGSTVSGTATGVPNTILKAFYTKTDRAKMAKTGSRSGLAIQVKNKIDKKQFLETFGIIDGKPTRDDRNTSARVLALANLTGKMMTNQAVRQNLEILSDNKQTIQNIREGASDVMFSKTLKKLDLIDFKKLINDPKNGIDNFDAFVDKMVLLSTYGESGLIRAVDLRNFGINNPVVKDYARSTTLYEDLGLFTIGKSKDRTYLRPDAKSALGKNINDITKAKVKKYNEVGKANFDAMIDMIQKAIKDNPNDIELHSAIYLYLSSAVNDTSHPLRAGAEYLGGDITITGEIVYEHAVQSATVRDLIMETLLKNPKEFNKTLKAIKKNYKLIALSKKDAKTVDSATYIDENGNLIKYKNGMGAGWDIFIDNWFDRYFNTDVNALNPNNIRLIKNNKTFAEEYGVTMSGKSPIIKSNLKNAKILDNAVKMSRSTFDKFQAQKQRGKKFVKDLKTREKFEKFQAQQRKAEKFVESIRPQIKQSRGITILDFDDTLATTKSLVKYTAPDGTTGTLNAEQFASTYQDLQDQGYTFDFSDFNKVVKGKLAPLFQKALKLQNKFGPENMFVLTARPPASQKAIFDFLKANGLNIPLKNITGLGNSTAEAKALWVADKVAEGYNDFYFADDALQNVQAVKNMLDQFDVKSKVQQAKVKFSKSMDSDFNKILQDVTGIEFKKRFSDIKARKRGEKKGRFRFFVPPSHEDFVGLLYNFMGKGRKGDQHRDFFEKALVRPLNRAYREIDTAKQAIANDYKALNKQFGGVKKKLRKKTPDGDFVFEDAIRVYLWNKHGYEIPGLSPTDQKNLVELVNNDAELKAYADAINIISKQDTYVDPGKGWEGGNIKTDLIDATGRVGREQYFAEFNENADIIFSPENLNKIEAAYGKDFRSALEDMLYRISTGINRPKDQSGTVNKFMNYLNGSVGTVMFFNVRSAILQQMSIVNYINFADNNIFAAAKAFANQKQYWKDFAFIFNSDMLKQRRGGIGTDINGADLAQAVQGSKDPTKVVISRLLQLGFLPTQIGDNIAIATGGATFYRNRINKYIKDGLSQKEAEAKAFTDFQDITQSTQQSSRPDMTSQQQASWIGKLVLNFQNITSQYNRIIKKAALDIYNRRITPPYTTRLQSDLGNLSKILYYGGIQNVIFYSLQTALFAVMFDDDNDEDQILKKRERVINGSIDSILRGSGIYGAVISTLKNTLIKFKEQREKGYNKDESAVLMELLNFSPVVGIKARQIVNAEKTINYNENIMSEMETFDAENPRWSAVTNYTQALTNFPANRLYQKTLNMRNALDKDYTNFQRVMFFSGYTTWSLGLGDSEAIINAKEKVKINKKNSKKKKPKKGFKGITIPQNVW